MCDRRFRGIDFVSPLALLALDLAPVLLSVPVLFPALVPMLVLVLVLALVLVLEVVLVLVLVIASVLVSELGFANLREIDLAPRHLRRRFALAIGFVLALPER